MYYRFRDVAPYWSKIATPLYLAPPLGVKPSDLRNDPWWRKTRMMGLLVSWLNLVIIKIGNEKNFIQQTNHNIGHAVCNSNCSLCCNIISYIGYTSKQLQPTLSHSSYKHKTTVATA